MRIRTPALQARKAAWALVGALAVFVAGCNQQEKPAHPVFEAKLTPPIPAAPKDWFVDATAESGISFQHQFCDSRIANIIESNGAGGAWLDFDNDGFQDLYLVNSGPLEGVTHHSPGVKREPNKLFRNLGNGRFEDATTKAGVAASGYGTAACAADYDNDGFQDLLVVNVGGCFLYHNNGNGTFTDVTAHAGTSNKNGTGIGAVFMDADSDGWLDLFVANYLSYDPSFKSDFHPESPYPGPLAYAAQQNKLYRNLGNGTFQDVSAESGIVFEGHRAMSVTTLDYNLDGAPDIYVSNDGTPNLLLLNDGKGHFKDVATQAGVAFNAMGEAAGSMAAGVADANGDGLPDLFVTRLGYGSLYLGAKSSMFDDDMMRSGLGALTRRFVGWGVAFMDAENDGDQDLFIANGDALFLIGQESLLLENDGKAGFSDASTKAGAAVKTAIRGRAVAVADYNNDGRLDVLATAIADRPLLLRNQSRATNSWIALDLEGTASNRDGFGAIVKLTAEGRTWTAQSRCAFGFLAQSEKRLHFGLGTAGKIDAIEIRWPSKQVQTLKDIQPGQILKIREPGERIARR